MKGAPPVPSATQVSLCFTTPDLAEWALRGLDTGSEGGQGAGAYLPACVLELSRRQTSALFP